MKGKKVKKGMKQLILARSLTCKLCLVIAFLPLFQNPKFIIKDKVIKWLRFKIRSKKKQTGQLCNTEETSLHFYFHCN